MEFLFISQSAWIEAIIMLACIFLIFMIFAYDGYLWIVRVIRAFHPRKAYVMEKSLIPAKDIVPPVQTSISAENINPILEEALPDEKTESISTPVEELVIESVSPEQIPEAIIEVQTPVDVVLPDFLSSIEHEESGISWETILESEPILSVSEEVYDDTHSLGKEPPIWENTEVPIDTRESLPIPEEKIELPSEKTILPIPETDTVKLHPEKKEKLIEIVNMVKTLIARGHIDEARAFIVSGLAIDKNHRELNLLMASLFEREHTYEKAEFIFKDLAIAFPDDIEILTHLATSLAMQQKYEVSYELYKKILTLKWEDEETLYTLTHLASELSLPEDVYFYGKSYLKQYPRNPEILWLYSQALITKWERKEAIEILIKLKNLTPYNQEIVDLIGKLVTEEELAGNFWGKE